MDAEDDEYAEEIAVFKRQNATIEYVIKPRINRFLVFQYSGNSVLASDDIFSMDLDERKLNHYKIEKIYNQKVVFA